MTQPEPRTAASVKSARRDWRDQLGYNAAEVAIVAMDETLARDHFGDDLVERIRADAFLLMMGESADWEPDDMVGN